MPTKQTLDRLAAGKSLGGAPKKYTDDFIKGEAIALLEYVKTAKLPFLKDFTFSRGWSSQYVSDFCIIPEFQQALLLYKDKFEAIVVEGAMNNRFNAFFSVKLLTNCCGWREKLDMEHSLDEETKEILNKYGTDGINSLRDRIAEFVGTGN